ncbi:MdtA/MuxA family multidrug efflux RND transporter periplasmic adaptor subunit [Ramlibacter solisilvae]|uniref:Secretion protein HlyD n=1 Tax=Ramlibacter tataouinensis TaxID=94132 RepID=A0A127JNZ4_9BURK|nr:efflux RND transporter periplasmic adaptor subunit [Ramlibacter tataouinensis]AMO21727.1 secretion protein HlyD [Ramlibacter tataouinensis]
MDPTPETRSEARPSEQPSPPARRISRRATLIGSVIALLVVAGLAWLAWDLTRPGAPQAAGGARQGAPGANGFGGPGGARVPPTTVGVATAERADIPIVVEALGTVVPQAMVRVRPQVSGVLQQVLFKEGQMVRKGEVLAVIDPRQFDMALQQATGQRMKDEAQLAAARVTLERYRTLLRQDSIARQDVDTQEAQVKQLEAALVVDKANEGTARLNLEYTRITAPVAGRAGLRTVDAGNLVTPSDANGVALITQLSPIDVEFAIPQDLAPEIMNSAGKPMEAKALDRTRANVLDTGAFASLDNQVDTQTGTVRAKARFDNRRGQLFPSQFVNVQLNVRTIRDAVVVPVAAVRRGSGGDFVFVLKEDRTVAIRPVKTGQATVDRMQIANGLQLGERVITEGADRLRDGSRVILPGDAPATGAQGSGRRRAASGAGTPQAPASAPGDSQTPAAAAAAPQVAARGSAPAAGKSSPAAAAAATAAPSQATATAQAAPAGDKPTAEQRQRMLDAVKDDPEQLERRKRFLDAIDRGDPQALERWRSMQQRRREGGGQ